MRISYWSSDVSSSGLLEAALCYRFGHDRNCWPCEQDPRCHALKLQLPDSWQWEAADQPSAQDQLARRLLLCNAPIAGKNAPAAFLPTSLEPFGGGPATGPKLIEHNQQLKFDHQK